jgi:hypothetical protein
MDGLWVREIPSLSNAIYCCHDCMQIILFNSYTYKNNYMSLDNSCNCNFLFVGSKNGEDEEESSSIGCGL